MPPTSRRRYLRQRRTWLFGIGLDSPSRVLACEALSDVLEANEATGPGAKTIVAVDALNGVGKSTLVRSWTESRYRTWIGDRNDPAVVPWWEPSKGLRAHDVPVVWINLQANSMIKEFNAQVLSFLGYPAEGVARATTTRVMGAFARHRVRILVVDDVHLLRTTGNGRHVLDHLKTVNTHLGEQNATMVLVGAGLGETGITSDPQMSARLRLVPLHPVGAANEDELRSWQDVLGRAEDLLLPYLPTARSGLLVRTLATQIWRRTQGYLGDVASLLAQCAVSAGEDGSWCIGREHVAAANLSLRAQSAEATLRRLR